MPFTTLQERWPGGVKEKLDRPEGSGGSPPFVNNAVETHPVSRKHIACFYHRSTSRAYTPALSGVALLFKPGNILTTKPKGCYWYT